MVENSVGNFLQEIRGTSVTVGATGALPAGPGRAVPPLCADLLSGQTVLPAVGGEHLLNLVGFCSHAGGDFCQLAEEPVKADLALGLSPRMR